MNQDEVLTLLKEGQIVEWNRRCKRTPPLNSTFRRRPDLRGADLSETDLHGADLSRAKLIWSQAQAGPSSEQSSLSGAELSGPFHK